MNSKNIKRYFVLFTSTIMFLVFSGCMNRDHQTSADGEVRSASKTLEETRKPEYIEKPLSPPQDEPEEMIALAPRELPEKKEPEVMAEPEKKATGKSSGFQEALAALEGTLTCPSAYDVIDLQRVGVESAREVASYYRGLVFRLSQEVGLNEKLSCAERKQLMDDVSLCLLQGIEDLKKTETICLRRAKEAGPQGKAYCERQASEAIEGFKVYQQTFPLHLQNQYQQFCK